MQGVWRGGDLVESWLRMRFKKKRKKETEFQALQIKISKGQIFRLQTSVWSRIGLLLVKKLYHWRPQFVERLGSLNIVVESFCAGLPVNSLLNDAVRAVGYAFRTSSAKLNERELRLLDFESLSAHRRDEGELCLACFFSRGRSTA